MSSNATIPASPPASTVIGDDYSVVPTTPLLAFLQRVQSAALQTLGAAGSFDPKLYVDLPLKQDLKSTAAAFDALPRHGPSGSITPVDLQRFLQDHFGDAWGELERADPVDFLAEPPGFLPLVKQPEVRVWAIKVHAIWKDLCRNISEDVSANPDRHTLLPLPNPVVVPGSRFRETYYWDSYWIVRGLLASKMFETAKGIVRNLVSLVDTYGYVLNGARSYYTNRTQPPLLSSMVREVYDRTADVGFVVNALPALLKEHKLWNSGFHRVTVKVGGENGMDHPLCRYYALWNKPRPETATIDKESAAGISDPHDKEKFYREVASTAESGWDFSSRWMVDPSDLTTLSTTSILPVDLNAFVLKMELDIAYLAEAVGDVLTSKEFEEQFRVRTDVFNSVFWNPEMDQWVDYWIPDIDQQQHEGVHQWVADNQSSTKIFASNFIPIWILPLRSDSTIVEKLVKSLINSGLLQANGIATSSLNTGQQWDFPNGWAPLQHMIVEGLTKSGSESARMLAQDIICRWIKTNYDAYKKTGAMHEKYNVQKSGLAGGGGEYAPQTGFGWSNGVVLAFLEEFGWPKERPISQ